MRKKEEPPECFICGKVMIMIWACEFSWKCYRCDVTEEHPPEKFVSRVRTVPCGEWFGEIRYIDHSSEYFPSPG